MQLTFIAELIKRLQTESPSFFKKLKTIALIIAPLIWGFNYLISKGVINIPNSQVITDLLNGLGGFILGVFGTAALPTVDPTLIDLKTKENVIQDVIENKPSEILNKI